MKSSCTPDLDWRALERGDREPLARWGRPRTATRWRAALRRAESGQAVLWVAVMLPLLLSVVGLVADGGVVFNARLDLQNAADAAARAGATQIDEGAYRESAGARVALDPARARRAAAESLEERGLDLDGTIDADQERVVVRVSRSVRTGFVRIVGIETARVGAPAAAELRFGVERGNR